MQPQAVARALAQSAALSQRARALIDQTRRRVACNRASVGEHASHNFARRRQLIIREKLADGRLPYDCPSIIHGGPVSLLPFYYGE